MTDLERAFKALQAKKTAYDVLWQYYDGNQPLRYSTARLTEIFGNINVRFTQNWCGVVVDSALERMRFRQFVVPKNVKQTRLLNEWWVDSEMALDADDVELCALVTGESFVLAERSGESVEAFYNDSRLVHIFYMAENPRVMQYAAKWWTDEAGKLRLNLYYPERIEKYVSSKKAESVQSAKGLERVDEEMEIANSVTIFHFRRERRALKSELAPSIIDTQDAVNKLFSDLMVSSEFGSFKQRYVISNADLGTLKNAPNEIWDIPAGDGLGQDTQVGEFGITPLDGFMNQMQKLASTIGKMSRTPENLFWLGARSDPSGEALMSMEAPLIAKVNKYIDRFSAEWARLGQFVSGLKVQAVYADPRTIQPLTQAQARQANVTAGIPLTTQLRWEGKTQTELDQMAADKQAESQAANDSMAVALLNAQRNMDQGRAADGGNGTDLDG